MKNKKTSKISDAILEGENLSTRISNDQLQGEFNYSQAEKILKKMLNMGLIDEVEFNKITELNRETFSPILGKIMP
ncbi:MAG TPA: SHOCT domain-containing protein [Lachnospiraceae bacterium]|nr:SHOCT domain-containing protein [Lachnospiraceae bacterium]